MEMNFLKSVPIFHCIIPHSLLLFAANPCAFELNFCLYVGSPVFCTLLLQPSAFSTAGKSVNFHVDLCAQCPELHRFIQHNYTPNGNISFSFYIMNGVPEAQSENIKLSDASQGDSELN